MYDAKAISNTYVIPVTATGSDLLYRKTNIQLFSLLPTY